MKTTTLLPNLRKGFTLIELLVVIAVIAILATIAVPSATKALGKARITQSSSNMAQIVTQIIAYTIEEGEMPGKAATTANAAFEDLFIEEHLDAGSKKLFLAPGIASVKNENSDVTTAGSILPGGTNAYSFVKGVDESSGAPIMMDDTTQLSDNPRGGKVALVATLNKDIIRGVINDANGIESDTETDPTVYTDTDDDIYPDGTITIIDPIAPPAA